MLEDKRLLRLENEKLNKVDVYKNQNHVILLTNNTVIIYTIHGEKLLKDYQKALEIIIDNVINTEESKVISVRRDLSTIEYITKISDVNRYYNNLKISEKIDEDYNIVRSIFEAYMDKHRTEESYKCGYVTNYFNEMFPCYIVEEDFSTADYYNNFIGRTIINTSVYLFYTKNNILTKGNIEEVLDVLKEKQFEVLLKSFKEEYLAKLFK